VRICRRLVWGGEGGLFTIGIAEEDRPRRWRAHALSFNPFLSEHLTQTSQFQPIFKCSDLELALRYGLIRYHSHNLLMRHVQGPPPPSTPDPHLPS